MVKVDHVTLYKKGENNWLFLPLFWKVSHVEVDCPNGDIARFEFEDQKISNEGVKVKRDFTFLEKWSKLDSPEENEIVKQNE